MENPNTFTNQNLFHTQVLKNALKQGAVPPGHMEILQDWSKNIAALNQQDRAAQQAAFQQKILAGLLGYQPASGNTSGTLKDIAAPGGYFDAALGQFEKEKADTTVALVKLMGPTFFNLDAISEDEQLSFVELARKQAAETPAGPFFLLSNLDEIRLYSLVHKRNTYEHFSLAKMIEDAAEYQRFYLLLNAKNMLSGQTFQWLQESIMAGLQEKLTQRHSTFRDAYGPLQPGVAVTLNDAFVVNLPTYERLMKEDPKSAEILRTFYPGDAMRRWHSDARIHWLIYTPKGQVDIDAYPAVKKHLETFKSELEKRDGDQKWYELDHAEEANLQPATQLRMGTGRLLTEPGFVMGEKDAQYGKNGYYISNADYFIFGLLNSNAIAKLIVAISRPLDNGIYEILPHQIESLPIPNADGFSRGRIGQLAQFCMAIAQDRRDAIRHFHGMTAFNLSPQKLEAKMSEPLLNWFAHDFATFRNEIIASFGVDIPADDLPLWSNYLSQEKDNLYVMNADLAKAENELNAIVYKLFSLDEDDIALIEQR